MKIFTLAFLMIVCFTTLSAQDGALDNAFGGGGIVTTAILSGDEEAVSVAIQTDGKIVAVGFSHNGSNNDFAVVRYLTDGSLDATFGGDGKVTTAIGSGEDLAYGIALQADGKIVVAGHTHNGGNYDFALARYLTDGGLDTTFDGDGIVITGVGLSDDKAYALIIQENGRIVAVGNSYIAGTSDDFAAVRYLPDGSLDTTFGGDGIVTTAVGTGSDYAYAVAIQADGRINAAGSFFNGSNADFAVVRYTPEGSLDDTFSGDGKITTAIGGANESVYGVAIQADGKVVATGYSDLGSFGEEIVVVRYDSAGSIDSSFGGDGIVTASFGNGNDRGHAMALQADGKIVVVGCGYTGVWNNLAVVRFDSSGALDNSFSYDGRVLTPVGPSYALGYGVAVQPDGKIVTVGRSYDGLGTNDVGVARFTGSSGPLPVELSSFTARCHPSGRSVHLSWTTATETDNVGWEVERRAIGDLRLASVEYQKIGFVDGAGTSSSRREYTFIDHTIFDNRTSTIDNATRFAYRLKQLDRSGSFFYSHEAEVEIGSAPQGFALSQNHPNPFNPSTTIRFLLSSSDRVTLEIFNELGEVVDVPVAATLPAGSYEYEWAADRLPSGVYLYRLRGTTFTQTRRAMLLK